MLNDPGRLAWTVLISSFVVFCIILTLSVLGLRWFLFESATPLRVNLTVARGTVGVSTADSSEEAERAGRIISRGTSLTTDSTSQGYIAITDPYTDETVAAFTLHQDGHLTLGETARPRFEFSSADYRLSITGLLGEVDVDIVPDLARDIQVVINNQQGTVRMSNGGRYQVTSQENGLSVFNRTGEVVLISPDEEGRLIPAGSQGHVIAASGELLVSSQLNDILPDGGFDNIARDEQRNPTWGCYDRRDDPSAVEGNYARQFINGRSVIQIARFGQAERNADSHGETGCTQFLGPPGVGISVLDYRFLELRANLLIRFQSLSTCGIQGSECPIMLTMKYLDFSGAEREWIHGFYADHDASRGWPLRCATCALDHERISSSVWYTFSSGNLIQLLPEDQRPQAILSIGFYASGHEYEVLLNELALLAGQASLATAPNITEPDEPAGSTTQQ